MKKQLSLFITSLFITLTAAADTCPDALGLSPTSAPNGWQYLPSPTLEGYTYAFFSAIHFFTFNEFFKKIICTYTAGGAPGVLTPRMLFISDKTYNQPYFSYSPPAPWRWSRSSEYIIFCQPGNNDPNVCVFQ